MILNRKKLYRVLSLVFVVLVLGVVFYDISAKDVEAISQTVTWGSSQENVRKVQQRLKQWDYYKGSVDGVFGSDTFQAVKAFQRKNGLSADGVAGPATLKAMGLWKQARTAPRRQDNPPVATRGGNSRNDVELLARAITAEAQGEPFEGQVAVGAVILNRVQSADFPNTLSGVVYQPLAFESVHNGWINKPATAQAKKAAESCLNGWDPTNGALYFWNPSKPVSKWIWTRTITYRIGNHVFGL